MIDWFLALFSNSQFMPHGHCYLWRPGILWTHVISDAIIAVSYFSIPVTLYYFIYKKKDAPYKWLFTLFAVFIFLCGTTHLIAIWTVWDPVYQIEGLAKAVTAIISFVTAACLIPVVPKLLSLRSPEILEKLNRELKRALVEKKQIEHQLVQSNESLEEKVKLRTDELVRYSNQLKSTNQELESFAHRASHDLKSPLSSILSMLDDIKSSDSLNGKFKSYVPQMELQLNRLNDLIGNLLDFSRLKEIEPQKEWCDLSGLLNDAKANLSQLIHSRDAKIYSDHSFDMFCNKSLMVSVLQNLLENAIKYTPESRQPEIIISTENRDTSWVISVIDNGPGVGLQHREEIFKPFYRMYSDDEISGTGLGLSICKRVVEGHGGEIAATDSPTGQGMMFTFIIPKP